ncbi:MAG: DinB family protein [Bryobacteraceae bacterium]
MKRLLLALTMLALPTLAGEDIVPKLLQHWKTSKAYTIAIAQQMPEADYGFRPNSEEMTFKEQLMHIAGMNEYFMSRITGVKAPLAKPATLDKASVIRALSDSFDYAIKTIGSLTSEQAEKNLENLLLAMDHTTHHRGQCVVYLRARGIKPAEYPYFPH